MTAGAGLTIAKFLVVDYAFESHPVFSPVHRVSVNFSPYLFGHKPREEGHLNKTDAAKKLVTEEPEEVPAEEFVEESIQESPVPVQETVNETPAAPSAPIIETDDEVLE